jgi:hypothetical protein
MPCTLGVRLLFAALLLNALGAQLAVLSRMLRTDTALMPAVASAEHRWNFSSGGMLKRKRGQYALSSAAVAQQIEQRSWLSRCSTMHRPLACFDIHPRHADTDIFCLGQLCGDQVLDHICQQRNKALQSELLVCLTLFPFLHNSTYNILMQSLSHACIVRLHACRHWQFAAECGR